MSTATYDNDKPVFEHRRTWAGVILTIISCSLAAVGVEFLGIVLMPIAMILAIVGFIFGLIHRDWVAMILAIVTWAIIITGAFAFFLERMYATV